MLWMDALHVCSSFAFSSFVLFGKAWFFGVFDDSEIMDSGHQFWLASAVFVSVWDRSGVSKHEMLK